MWKKKWNSTPRESGLWRHAGYVSTLVRYLNVNVYSDDLRQSFLLSYMQRKAAIWTNQAALRHFTLFSG